MMILAISGYRRSLTRQEHGVDVMEIAAMAMPEIADLRLQVNQFDTVRKPVVYVFNVFVMDAVAFDESCLYAVEERLLNTCQLGVSQEVSCHGRARQSMPKPGRTGLGGVVEVKAQRDQLAHDRNLIS